MRITVTIEATPTKSFATAADWPGWSRSGKTEELAVEALAGYAGRYEPVVALAGEKLPTSGLEFEVVERIHGNGATAYGVPGLVTDQDRRAVDRKAADRLARLVVAAWQTFESAAASAPDELRKGPRGGGRNTSKMVDHVRGADQGYAQSMGLKMKPIETTDRAAIDELRAAVADVLRQPNDGSPIPGRKWTTRYVAHRIAWHALDHAWEIEDRIEPQPGPG